MFLVGKLVRAVVFRASEGVPTGNLTTVTVLERMTVNSRIADRFANDRSARGWALSVEVGGERRMMMGERSTDGGIRQNASQPRGARQLLQNHGSLAGSVGDNLLARSLTRTA
jgi:hypothetical protein